MGRDPVVPQSLIIENWEERLVRGPKPPKALKFATISFALFWLFAIIAETKRVLVSFRNLHLLELKIKNFVGNFWLIYVECERAGWPDKLNRSGHSFILYPDPFYQKGKVSFHCINKHRVKNYPGGINI